jgi:hypothetical protein
VTPDEVGAEWLAALHQQDGSRDRSEQAALGILGVSDIGTCRQRAAYMVRGAAATDSPQGLAAWIGTALHKEALAARKTLRPELNHEVEVTVTTPSGFELTGHIDEIDGDQITDLKTADGLAKIRHSGASQQQTFQRHLYGLGAIQAGLVHKDRLVVRNVWMDRSGRDKTVHVEQEPFSPEVIAEANLWLEDVEYAVRNSEDASRDQPSSWCKACCPFFTACRGGETVAGEVITDPDIIETAKVYRTAKDQAAIYSDIAEDARRELDDVEGKAGDLLIRWTSVNSKNGSYRKLSVTEIAA